MFSVRAGADLEKVAIPYASYNQPAYIDRPAYSALRWIDPKGRYRAVFSVTGAGMYWPENAPPAGPGITDHYAVFDKLLEAVERQYDIQTYVNDNGLALLVWNRASHGNEPALTLSSHNVATLYYQARHRGRPSDCDG